MSGLLLSSCSTVTVPELAPESVAGRIIRLDDRFTQICERPIEGGPWSAWTDFKYGSVQELISSLRRLTALPEDTVFYSGHGEAGKLSRERKY